MMPAFADGNVETVIAAELIYKFYLAACES